jgi:hypothetical protein
MKALNDLLAKLGEAADTVTDEQLSDAVTAIREQLAAVEQMPSASIADRNARIEVLTGIKAVRDAVAGEQASRAAAAADLDAEAQRLMDDITADPAPVEPTDKTEDDGGETGGNAEAPAEQVPEPVAATAGITAEALAAAVVAGVDRAMTTRTGTAPVEGRKVERVTPRGAQPEGFAAGDNVVRGKVFLGKDSDGRGATNILDVAKAVHDTFRGSYQAQTNGRFPVAHVDTVYPEARHLNQDASGNYHKMEATTNPTAIVAAGGLCAPLENLYDVEVIGSAERPIRDSALTRFQVERGGIQYRPNVSAASAVYGSGVWTMTDDAAGTGTKACYQVDCPGLQTETVEAIYECLEFSNITAMYDPETTASNVKQGDIAHARLAENRLLAKMASQSKLLTAVQVIGATRDILANVDKTTAYYRNRHRISAALPLTWVAPGWVKSLMRADLARQMAAGDWAEALAPADSLINSWFSARGVTPVWHMDGPAGLDEVQTVTITGTPTGGTFTLTFSGQTTAAIAYNATAATVEAALAALSNIRDEDITVTGGPGPGTAYTVTFDGGWGGAYDGANVAAMTATGSFTGGSTPAVAVTTATGGGGALTVSGVSIAGQVYPDAAAAAAIPGFPGQIDSLLYTPGSWLFLDGGELNLGLVRDSSLNARNRYRQFMETFEGAAFRGIESLRLVMSVEPTGQTSGTKDLSAIAD